MRPVIAGSFGDPGRDEHGKKALISGKSTWLEKVLLLNLDMAAVSSQKSLCQAGELLCSLDLGRDLPGVILKGRPTGGELRES